MPQEPLPWRWVWVLAASLLVSACAGAPRRYALDTVSNTCRQSPVQCAGMYGSEGARAKAQMAASAGVALASAQRVLDAVTQARVEALLVECAEEALFQVLLRRMGGRNPTPVECHETVAMNARGEPVTRAMQLGQEMHQLARACAHEKLGELLPGHFSLEQRYRYDRQTGQTTLVTPEEEAALLRRGLARELVGTLKPDVVIHRGNPLLAQAVYDFKFPCVSRRGDRDTSWRKYPEGHPYDGYTQKEMYQQVLRLMAEQVWRILPRWGVLP